MKKQQSKPLMNSDLQKLGFRVALEVHQEEFERDNTIEGIRKIIRGLGSKPVVAKSPEP